jgi:two-component system, chemotaxis family, response regulator Rcp1
MNQRIGQRPAQVLLVEDSPTDVLMTQEALGQTNLLSNLHVVEDGVEAVAFLRRTDAYGHVPRPDLILLDWNLPRKNGREVLAEVKADADLKAIPIVVLTTSQAERDVLTAYSLHANCYVTKPINLKDFIQAIHEIVTFWFTMATLPPG